MVSPSSRYLKSLCAPVPPKSPFSILLVVPSVPINSAYSMSLAPQTIHLPEYPAKIGCSQLSASYVSPVAIICTQFSPPSLYFTISFCVCNVPPRSAMSFCACSVTNNEGAVISVLPVDTVPPSLVISTPYPFSALTARFPFTAVFFAQIVTSFTVSNSRLPSAIVSPTRTILPLELFELLFPLDDRNVSFALKNASVTFILFPLSRSNEFREPVFFRLISPFCSSVASIRYFTAPPDK